MGDRAMCTTKATKSPARRSRNQKNRNISRKDAKHVLSNVEGAAKKKNNIYPNFAFLCALAGQISESEMFHMSENSRKPRKLSSIVVTRFSPDFAGKRRFALLANSCNRKPNYLPQRRQGAKLMNPCPSSRANARDLKKISPGVYPELGRRGRNDNKSKWPPLREK